jgi:hypothetical protein
MAHQVIPKVCKAYDESHWEVKEIAEFHLWDIGDIVPSKIVKQESKDRMCYDWVDQLELPRQELLFTELCGYGPIKGTS